MVRIFLFTPQGWSTPARSGAPLGHTQRICTATRFAGMQDLTPYPPLQRAEWRRPDQLSQARCFTACRARTFVTKRTPLCLAAMAVAVY